MAKLIIKDLHASVSGHEILKGVNLEINEGETWALLGPNGHGKSTLLACVMGNPTYTITKGSIFLDDVDLTVLTPDKRSLAGLFLGMQYPSEIPGLNSSDFLKASINARREKPISLFQFYNSLKKAYDDLEIPFEFSNRNLNEGFSGGEKKRNEILQMKLLQPKISMLDEIDSGLDVDALQIVSKTINEEQKRGCGFMIISHYARLYELLHVDRAAIMVNGRIVVDGKPDLIEKIDKKGYSWIKDEYGISIEKENDESLNGVSIGACATREATK